MSLLQRLGRRAVVTSILLVGCLLASGNQVRAQAEAARNTKFPQQVLIIRHAEKTGEKSDVHLSKKGVERADVLFQIFEASKTRPMPFPRPDFIFAAKNSTNSQRPLETIQPLAKKLGFPIDQKYDSKRPKDTEEKGEKENMIGLRAEIFGMPKYRGKTILVSWRHSTIPDLAKTLGAKDAPSKWADEVYDRVWQLNYDDVGNVVFLDLPQRLLPGDSEK
jgi:hypothetical protein